MINVVDSGLVYRNPQPHLRARQVWHPTAAAFDDQHWLVAFDMGQAVESLDYRTWLTRTRDGGKTWEPPRQLVEADAVRPSNDLVRVGRVRNGHLVGFAGRLFRDNPQEGFVNRANLGYVPMQLFLISSIDQGETWTTPQWITPPLVGPAFEMCHAILELADGRWLAPTSTWRGWHGDAPHGMQAVGLLSRDRGTSWTEWTTIVDQYASGVISWEVGVTPLNDGRLLAVVWSFDEKSGQSLPSRYAIGSGAELRFSPPRENGLLAETAKLVTLPDGRVLCVYRRLDEPGLWASEVHIDGEQWINRAHVCLWQGSSGMRGRQSAADELSALQFGFPNLECLSDTDVLVCFWCLEDTLQAIRWMRLRLSD